MKCTFIDEAEPIIPLRNTRVPPTTKNTVIVEVNQDHIHRQNDKECQDMKLALDKERQEMKLALDKERQEMKLVLDKERQEMKLAFKESMKEQYDKLVVEVKRAGNTTTKNSNNMTNNETTLITQESDEPHQKSRNKRKRISKAVRGRVVETQNNACGECKQTLTLYYEIDHIIGLQFGGTDEEKNLMALCRECHGKKSIAENQYKTSYMQAKNRYKPPCKPS